MIIAKITDGLGNQLFQYAAARRLAIKHRTPLMLHDCTQLSEHGRKFGLHKFHTKYEVAKNIDLMRLCPLEVLCQAVYKFIPGRFYGVVTKSIAMLRLTSPYNHRIHTYSPHVPRDLLVGRVISERQFHFDPDVLLAPDNVCMVGFWQDQRYFSDIHQIIAEEFRFNTPPSPENARVAHDINTSNSVSLHIRRGDKISNANFTYTSARFCQASIAYARSVLQDPVFYVFSDDWEWTRSQLPESPDLVHVAINGPEADTEDLRLMSMCKHNIIASSSFSWWAAWLNNYHSKLVMTPPHEKWTNFSNFDASHVLPKHWKVIYE